MAEPSPELRAGLRAFLSERCALGNPVDLTVEATGANYERALRLLLEGGYDAAIAVNVATPFLDSLELARGVIAARDAVPGKPIAAVFAAGQVVAEAVGLLQRAGIPSFPSGERAALALARLREREELRAAARRAPRGPLPKPRPLPWPSPPAEPAGGPIPEPEGWAFLGGLRGLPLPAYHWCRTAEEAAQACGQLPSPLVLKVVSPEPAQERSGRGRAGPAGCGRGWPGLRRAGRAFQRHLLPRGAGWPNRWPAAWR